MPEPLKQEPTRADDLKKLETEATIDPAVYGRLLSLGRSATYRALREGHPIKPIRIGGAIRIPTPPLRELLLIDAARKPAA